MKHRLLKTTLFSLALSLAGCGPADAELDATADADSPSIADLPTQRQALTTSRIKYVFVIAMENHAAAQIYGSASAPYINGTLIPNYGHATNYVDNLASTIPSEPHYVWLEAGTNAFSDLTFTTDNVPSSVNATTSTAHLSTQIKNATNGVSWMSYQEGLNSTTGSCPIAVNGFYAPKHDPFLFFKDVVGATPSKTNAYCVAHHKPYSSLATDLANKTVATYNFITPNQCNDMHGQSGCTDTDYVHAGDVWLQNNLPQLISFSNANQGLILVVWDEPETSGTMPFLVIGPQVKPNFANSITLSHSSVLKSVEQILNLPTLSTVTSANDLSSFFNTGTYP
jgi:hypothetical protein